MAYVIHSCVYYALLVNLNTDYSELIVYVAEVLKCLALALIMHSYTLAFVLQADIRPQTDGCNGLRYNLTADIIESIFRTYPAGEVIHLTFIIVFLGKVGGQKQTLDISQQ